MSWKKHFTVYNSNKTNRSSGNGVDGYNTRFQSWLPEVYKGMPNRTERYMQYDQMDMDVEVNMALDTIAEFATNPDMETQLPFSIVYKDEPTESETKIIKQALKQWCNINEWDKRIFKTFRNVIKYGDQPFVRDPETWQLLYVNPQDVIGVVINESQGKEPEQYILRNLDLNVRQKTATTPIAVNKTTGGISQSSFTSPRQTSSGNTMGNNVTTLGSSEEEVHVDSTNVIHLAMSEGMDANYPFGNSILDSVFKTYKQKELLEDSIIIYRVQRAPERRVFYIDTGDMPPHRATAFLEKIKMEVHQKRIPNKTGGGSGILDAQYNPMSILDDYFFSTTGDGRGSKVEVLPGGSNLSEIEDLLFFTDKLLRGLRVPNSYMPQQSSNDSGMNFTDGRVGTAFIQEFRFNKYCLRLQDTIQPTLDREFKRFMKHRGFNIDSSMFEIKFPEPQSFSDYRQIELDSARAGIFGQMDGVSYMSRRFILKKYLGLSDSEILENERMYVEENPSISGDALAGDAGLNDIGIRGSDFEDFGEEDEFDLDQEMGDEFGADTESPISGAEGQESEPEGQV